MPNPIDFPFAAIIHNCQGTNYIIGWRNNQLQVWYVYKDVIDNLYIIRKDGGYTDISYSVLHGLFQNNTPPTIHNITDTLDLKKLMNKAYEYDID